MRHAEKKQPRPIHMLFPQHPQLVAQRLFPFADAIGKRLRGHLVRSACLRDTDHLPNPQIAFIQGGVCQQDRLGRRMKPLRN